MRESKEEGEERERRRPVEEGEDREPPAVEGGRRRERATGS